MKIKLDENLGKSAADLLRQAGHDVTSVPQQKMCSASDRELIAVCQSERRCLVTLDLDFANPLLFNPTAYAGIVVLRLPPKPSAEDLAECVQTLIGGLTKADVPGRLWIVQRRHIREYQGNN